MAVEGVNNRSNAGYYALGAATIGAGAGASAAYLTNPFLKDGAPTDEFIKSMDTKMKEVMPKDARELTEQLEKLAKEVQTKINNAKDVAEIKNIFLEQTTAHLDSEILNAQKEFNVEILQNLQSLGCDVKPEQVKKFSQCNSIEEVKQFMGEIFDNQYKGKNVDEIKQALKAEAKAMERQVGKGVFEQFWDAGKKEFVNCEEGIGKAVKSAAKSIQGKYALIYGAIGAAVLGLGTLLFAGKSNENPQNNTQA
jgi:hypothetical protein